MTTQGIFLTVFGRTVVGKKRSKDEDAFLITDLSGGSPLGAMKSAVSLQSNERGILIAVSDGMGGAEAGDVASTLVLSALGMKMTTAQASSPEQGLRHSIEEANQQVFNTAQSTGRVGMGATLTAVLFHDLFAYTAEIGDSRAYLMRDNRMVQLTRDQSYVQTLIDMGAITAEEAKTSDFKNVIVQAMGLGPKIEVALRRISIRAHDRFLVCSDGLCGTLKDQDMLSLMLGNATLESVCTKLIELAVARGAEDDITVILAEVNGEGAPAVTGSERVTSQAPEAFATTLDARPSPVPASA